MVQVDKPAFKRALKKAHAEEEKPEKEFTGDDLTDVFEVERSVFPSLSNFVEHLDEQLWKAFQKLNHTDIAYIERIKDENALLFLVDKVRDYFAQFKQEVYLARIAIIKLTYLYYKNDSIYERIKSRLAAKGKSVQ